MRRVTAIGRIPEHDNIGERARFGAFFALDAMKGRTVGRRVLSDYDAWKRGSSIAETQEKIRSLIDHAARTTKYYSGFDTSAPLEKLPVVNKDTFREHYEEFRSSVYRDAKGSRVMTTSGSTGTPFAMIQDRRKALCNTADGIFLSMLGGYRIGEKTAFIRVWVDNVKKSSLRLFAENTIMMESSSLSDESIASMLETIRREKVKCITGYASALGEISRFIDANGTDMSDFSVHTILPISETMPDPVRARLREQFRCPVRSYYSNEENGIMGIENADDNSYYINSESYYIEILKEDCDEPQIPGKPGRIVLTDLTNYAFPVIRYDNGDMAAAVRTEKDGRFRLMLTELCGRRSDQLYDTSGRIVTPYVITNNFWDVEGVKQYRFLQTGEKSYCLRLNGDRSVMDVTDMLDRIRPALGEDAEITVEYVDEIPVLASGKRKYIENLWKGGVTP